MPAEWSIDQLGRTRRDLAKLNYFVWDPNAEWRYLGIVCLHCCLANIRVCMSKARFKISRVLTVVVHPSRTYRRCTSHTPKPLPPRNWLGGRGQLGMCLRAHGLSTSTYVEGFDRTCETADPDEIGDRLAENCQVTRLRGTFGMPPTAVPARKTDRSQTFFLRKGIFHTDLGMKPLRI